MELRQLRYFVTLAEELHFGRAGDREHIVQSALSQQVQRPERELGVRLLERSAHHVALTASGVVVLVEARQVLAHAECAAKQAWRRDRSRSGVPEQYQPLLDGRPDGGVGRATLAPPQIASLLFRRDPVGVLVLTGHPFAGQVGGVAVAGLAREPLLLAVEARAPEFNQFTAEMCRAAGFAPTVYRGTAESIRVAADLVARGRCPSCVPSSCIAALPGTIWRSLIEPASGYPCSVPLRAAGKSATVQAVVSCAQAMSKRLGWLTIAEGDNEYPHEGRAGDARDRSGWAFRFRTVPRAGGGSSGKRKPAGIGTAASAIGPAAVHGVPAGVMFRAEVGELAAESDRALPWGRKAGPCRSADRGTRKRWPRVVA